MTIDMLVYVISVTLVTIYKHNLAFMHVKYCDRAERKSMMSISRHIHLISQNSLNSLNLTLEGNHMTSNYDNME